MAIPSNPTVALVVAEGLRRGGRVTPTATMVTDATASMFQEVKTDINTIAGLHNDLKTESYTTVVRGMRDYYLPEDAQELAYAHMVLAPTAGDWIGTAQAGSTMTITLAAGFSLDEDSMIGRRIFMTGGSGSGQTAQVVAWDNATKVATFGATLSTATSATTTYLVEQVVYRVWINAKFGESFGSYPYAVHGDVDSTLRGRKLVFKQIPTQTAVIIWSYWAALDRLDEAGEVFVRHLRTNRSLWTQGIATKTNQRYDEDRYAIELKVYDAMLTAYGSTACCIREGTYTD